MIKVVKVRKVKVAKVIWMVRVVGVEKVLILNIPRNVIFEGF